MFNPGFLAYPPRMEPPRRLRSHRASDRLPRIAVGGILHETNTFAPRPTMLADFEERSFLLGQRMIDVAGGTDSALGGVIAAAQDRAVLVPTLFTSAMPGGRVTNDTFSMLSSDLLDRLRRADNSYPRLDGVVLLLHGAMVTETEDDPEGFLLGRVREIVGAACPIAVVLDSHANITRRMVQTADLIVGYGKYPHIDTWARGYDILIACLDMITGKERPVVAFRKLPLLMPLVSQSTDHGDPLTPVLERTAWWRSRREIASISIVPGFPYSDVPDAGAALLVYAWDFPGFREYADRAADELSELWWSGRGLYDLQAAPLEILFSERRTGTTVVADVADNPGAGAPCDSTHILCAFLDHGLEGAAFSTIVDPEAVAACHKAGKGATLDIGIGGKASRFSGEPVIANWQIDHLGDGTFANEGPMSNGAVSNIGRTATVRSQGISVILCERRAQTLDPAAFRAGGIEPEGCRWLVVKSSVHYRAAFRTLANKMIDVECPGLSTSNLRALTYNRVRRPIAPLDEMNDLALSRPGQDSARA